MGIPSVVDRPELELPRTRIWRIRRRFLTRITIASMVCGIPTLAVAQEAESKLQLKVTQLTHGPQHHLFGYIGQCRTIPWNESGRYIVALRCHFHDHMPTADEAADIVLIDTRDRSVVQVEKTRAWNLQQGTMLYWHPKEPETQFFFNDRDPVTQKIFTVLYDVERRRRIREYRDDERPVANGGVSQDGEYFMGINYARMARLRSVTGYPETWDWTQDELAPHDDGLFRIDIESGKRRLLISFQQLADRLKSVSEDSHGVGLYINHTLCSRESDRIFFFVRGRLGSDAMHLNSPCTIRPDGTEFDFQKFIGGHPEWAEGNLMIGAVEDRQVVYDVTQHKVVQTLGDATVFAKPGGDISLSPDGRWLANGSSIGRENRYVVFDRETGGYVRSPEFSRGPYQKGDLRIDPAPRWNRTNDAILVPGFTVDGTRQLFLIDVSR